MCNFKPGQRVRVVRRGWAYGKEGTILHVGISSTYYDEGLGRPNVFVCWLRLDNGISMSPCGYPLAFEPHYLRPLTPPGFEQFMERVTQWVPPVAPPSLSPPKTVKERA